MRLFRRRTVHGAPSCIWPGHSGKEYPYQIHPIGAAFKPESGNYILASESEAGGWVPLYVAQSRDVHQRLEGYEKQQKAVEMGATHIHVHVSSASQAARCEEERDLILRWQPACNDPLES
jgi:hypothetical protein